VTTTAPSGTAAGTYPVTITIGGATSNAVNIVVGPAPTGPFISAIVGESGKTALCPGDVAILSGLNLGANPTVTVGGKAAFNITVNNGNQITIQLPVDAPLGTANVTLASGNATSPAFSITLTQYAPALFPGGGFPNAAIHVNSGFTPVTQQIPAFPGEQLALLAYGLQSERGHDHGAHRKRRRVSSHSGERGSDKRRHQRRPLLRSIHVADESDQRQLSEFH
jgi:hypothetical protein